MIIQLLPEQITEYWDIIRFAALSVNPHISSEIVKSKFTSGLIAKLLSLENQAWVGVKDGSIKGIAITEVQRDIGNLRKLLISAVYMFEYSTEEDRVEFMSKMLTTCKNLNCVAIKAISSNPIAFNALDKLGMKEVGRIFEVEVI